MDKIIGVDIDGVITKEGTGQDNVWLNALSNYLGKEIQRKKDVYDFREAYCLSKEVINGFMEERLEDIFANLSPYPEVKKVLTILKNRGFKICLITARDKSYRDITEKWLNEHEIPYHELHHNETKADLAIKKDINIFIEDNQENIRKFIKQGITVIVMDKYHNQDLKEDNIYRANNWNDIKNYLEGLIGINFP